MPLVLVKIEKKRLALGILAVLLILVGFILGRTSIPKDFIPQPTPTTIPSSAEFPTFSPAQEIFKVTRVIDGDTIEIEPSASSGRGVGQRVRYIGIDTPETVDPRKPVQCFGVEAAKKNKELVEGKIVRLEKDVTDKDKYGRLLRYVYVATGPGELFVNLELVRQGFAYSYTYPPDVKYQQEILEAERWARENNLGLWQNCP